MSHMSNEQRICHEKRIIAQYIIAVLNATEANGIRINYGRSGACKTFVLTTTTKRKFQSIVTSKDAKTVVPFLKKVLKSVEGSNVEDIFFDTVPTEHQKNYEHFSNHDAIFTTEAHIHCVYGNYANQVVSDCTDNIKTMPLFTWIQTAEELAALAETYAYEKQQKNPYKLNMAELSD